MNTSIHCARRGRLTAVCTIALALGFARGATAADYLASYPIATRARVEVRADNATVHVTTADGPRVAFKVSYDPQDWPDGTPPITSRHSGDAVSLTVNHERDDGWDWHFWDWNWRSLAWWDHRQEHRRGIAIEVQMPKSADLQLQSSNGAVSVAALNGTIGIHTSNGQIHAQELSGTMDIGTSNGAITLESLKGTLTVHTSNGTINAIAIDGNCGLYTSNGHIEVAGRFDSLDLSSSNGPVTARVETGSRMASGWKISTSNSRIDLSVPTDLKASLDASTSNGRIEVALPVVASGVQSKTRFAGAINGGGPELSLRTSNGSMSVRGS